MDLNRKTALETLLNIEKKGAYSNLALNENIRKYEPENEAFVRELVYGVLKNKYLLDYYLKSYVKKGFNRLKAEDLSLLRMGAYQALFMDSVPDYAALNETIRLAHKYARGREGFINAVLRSLVSNKESLGDIPREDFLNYLSVKYSIEEEVCSVILKSLGEEGTEAYLRACNETPELSIRVNVLKNTREELLDELRGCGFFAKLSDKSERALIVSGSGILKTDAFREGRFSVQDEASIMVSDLLGPEEGMKVLDLCAAPGGKTLANAELMRNTGSILACDIYEHKLKLIEEAQKRNGIDIIKTEMSDGTVYREDLKDSMDRVLCDVPCSGLGVIRRKPEIKYRKDLDLKVLIDIQSKILLNASRYLKKGGVMVYSTCTVNRDENQGVTEGFLKDNPNYRKIDEYCLSPLDGTDGFYMCKIIREA